MKRAYTLLLLSWIAIGFSACARPKFDQAYRELYLTRHALDFPSDRSALDNCVAKKLAECLAAYRQSARGKKTILSADPHAALKDALDTVSTKCPLSGQRNAELCEGALVSFYFYVKPDEDRLLLQTIERYPPSLQTVIFGGVPYPWFRNRPDLEPWLRHIQNLPESIFSRIAREQVVEAFQGNSRYVSGGVALL